MNCAKKIDVFEKISKTSGKFQQQKTFVRLFEGSFVAEHGVELWNHSIDIVVCKTFSGHDAEQNPDLFN